MLEENEILDRALQGGQRLEQSVGSRKQSVFYEEIDEVLGCRDGLTLRHVTQTGSSSDGTSVDEEKATNDEVIVAEEESTKEKRTERKLSRKRGKG